MTRNLYSERPRIWDHARMIEAEIGELRKTAHEAGELELQHALKAAERAFAGPDLQIVRAQAGDDVVLPSLKSLRDKVANELSEVQGRTHPMIREWAGLQVDLERERAANSGLLAANSRLQAESEQLRAELEEARQKPDKRPVFRHRGKS